LERKIMKDLLAWKSSPRRKPLILQGVRQSGKTYILNLFGHLHYRKTAYFNFEDHPVICEVFKKDLDTNRIIFELAAHLGSPIDKEHTLIFLDEIQLCPRALTSLKYFCENNNEYHIVTAGSLLSIQLAQPTSYPVGTVDLLFLYPLSFEEFLKACGQEQLLEIMNNLVLSDSVSAVAAGKLQKFWQDYQICGGMPEAAAVYIQDRDTQVTDTILDNLLMLYDRDIRKYAKLIDSPKIELIWHSIPSQLARVKNKFIYKDIKEGARARDYENALQWLVDAGMVHRVTHISEPRIPLSAYEDLRYFKIFALDIGLLRRLAGLSADSIITSDQHYVEFKGAMAENAFVQEMLAYGNKNMNFWTSGNTAEIDFIITLEDRIIPIEIKSAERVRSKSLAIYDQRYQPDLKVRISTKGFSFTPESRLLSLPLHLLFCFRKLAE
jgi:predicted AAA+ superfamily ATPase